GGTAVLEPPRSAPPPQPPAASVWDDFLRHISPSQRDGFLALARAQGFAGAHRILPSTNGSSANDDATTHWNQLNHLLSGKVDSLGSIREIPLTLVDSGLDATQREAVGRALATPDVAVILGWPGTGKSRVVAELITQALLRGERVLFAGTQAA